MTILITGGAGLLGSRLAEWIKKQNPETKVVIIDDLSGGYMSNVPDNCIYINKNIATDHLSDIFRDYQFDIVYHLAAYAAEGLSPFIRKFNYTNNVVGTASIINECIRHNVKRLVFTSSIAAYGDLGNQLFDEEAVCSPIDPYGIAKLACEMDIKVAYHQHGLEYCIIRPHNIIGRNQNIWDSYRNVMGIWMYNKLHNLPITIYGDGQQTRAFTIIDNILEPLWMAGTSQTAKCQTINLGGIKEYTINELAQIFQSIVGKTDVEYLEQRHEVKTAIPTHKKSQILLNYQEQTFLIDGINEMWQWAQQQPDRPRFVWPHYELDKGIYAFWR